MTWKSKVFLTAVVDTLVGLTVLLIGRFAPAEKEFLGQFFIILQPLAVVVIGIIAGDEAGKKVRALLPFVRFDDDDKLR